MTEPVETLQPGKRKSSRSTVGRLAGIPLLDMVDGITRPMFSGAGDFVWIEFGNPDCARNLRRLVEAAYDALDLRADREQLTSLVFHVAWVESNSGQRRENHNRLSLFGLTVDHARQALASREHTKPLLAQAAGLPTSDLRLDDSIQSLNDTIERKLRSARYDLLSAQLALIHAVRGSSQPLAASSANAVPGEQRQGEVPAQPRTLEEEADIWADRWERDRAEERPAFIDGAATADRLLKPGVTNPASDEATEKPDPIVKRIEKFIADHAILSAAAIPVLFSAVMPLLLKWFGGADTDPEVPRYFALAVRGFSLIYFVLPSLLAYALLMDALSVAAIAAMTSPLILLLFSRPTEWSTQQWNGVTGLLGIVIVFTMGWQMKRRVSLRRRDGLSNVGMPVVLLASFLVAYAGVMRRTALDYDAIFSRPMSVTRSADKLIRGIDSLATFRRDAEAMAVAGIVPALAESEKGLKLHDGELSQQYRALHRAILSNTNHLDSTNANMWSGTESSLVSGLSRELGSVRVFAGAVRVLAGARVKSTASAYVRDSTRIAKAQELSRTQGNAALKSAAQQLLAVARRQTQKAWATELQRVQAAGQVALVLLLAALGIATAQAANAQRKRAVVLLCGVAVLALPTLRPVFADALDPLHPLTTFSLPTSSVAGLALSAVPGAHDPKKDLGVPESSVGVTQDSSLVVLLRSMKESVGAVSSKLDGAKEVLSSVDGRLAEQKP